MNFQLGATEPIRTETEERMDPESTALVLVGLQNEYFAPGGSIRGDLDSGEAADQVLAATIELVGRLADTKVLVVSTPIVFTPTYEELIDPVGLLAAIRANGAFQRGTEGSRPAAELERFGASIVEVAGRRGLNAFSDHGLDELLAGRGIVDVVVAGALACVNVDSTGRSAHQRGYRVGAVRLHPEPNALRAGPVPPEDLPALCRGGHLEPAPRPPRHCRGRGSMTRGTSVTGEELQILVQYQLVAALDEREHDLAETQRLAHLGSWSWDMTSGEVTWSDELYRIFGVVEASFVPSIEAFFCTSRSRQPRAGGDAPPRRAGGACRARGGRPRSRDRREPAVAGRPGRHERGAGTGRYVPGGNACSPGSSPGCRRRRGCLNHCSGGPQPRL